MAVPYTFGSATTSIPLSQLDSNFATTITLGNTAVQLGNTITNLTGVSNVASASALSLGSNGNTTAITVDTSQNVGIGTAGPTAKLDISNGGIKVSTGGYNLTMQGSASSGTLNGLFIAGVPRVTDDTGTFENTYIGCGASVGNIIFQQGNSSTTSSNTERARIDSSGSFMVGTTSSTPAGSGDTKGISLNSSGSSSQIYSTGNNDTCAVFNRAGSDGATVRLRRQGSDVGSISTTASATAYNTSSDYRLKDNVQPMTGALAKVALLKPVTYKWKVDGSDGEGFIAHELAEVKPDCVSGDKDATRKEEYEVTPAVKDEEGNITTPAVMGTRTVPVYQGIDTSFLVATLTAAIQELKAIVDAQATTIAELQAKVA